MRGLKIAVVVMGLLIVAGTLALVIGVARRTGGSAVPSAIGLSEVIEAVLHEPPETHIAGIAAVQDRLAVQLQGGGADRIVLIDTRSGAVVGRIALMH